MAWWSPRALPEILEADESHLSAFLRPLLAQHAYPGRGGTTSRRVQAAGGMSTPGGNRCRGPGAGAAPTRDRRQSAALGISKWGDRHLRTLLVPRVGQQASRERPRRGQRVENSPRSGTGAVNKHQTREASSNNGCVGNTRQMARPVRSAPFKPVRPQRPSRLIGCSRRGARIFHRGRGYSNAQPEAG